MKLEKFKEKDNKKKSIIMFTICCILLIAGVFLYQSFALFETRENFNFIEGNISDPGDLYFTYYIDDQITLDFPSKDSGYTMSSKSNCTNGVTVTWNDEAWTSIINYSNYQKEKNSRVKCDLYFEPRKPTLVEHVIELAKTDTTNLVYDGTSDNNLRYIGANPNNYVYFNCDDASNPTKETCELWRIIGVMNNIDNGTGQKESRIKLIRNEPIGNYSWDTSESTINGGRGINEWSQADAMKLLNPGHDSESVGGSLYWNQGSGTCYSGEKNAMTACDFSDYGLKENSKAMIEEAVWNTGANGTEPNYTNQLTSKFYELERSTNTGKICMNGDYCNDTVNRTTTWTGYIGLMYPSDFGYATSGGTTTNRDTCLNLGLYDWSDLSVSDCCENDWLYKETVWQWSIFPLSYTSSSFEVLSISYDYCAINQHAFSAYSLSPVLYLNTNVKIVSGEGSEESPIIIIVQ